MRAYLVLAVCFVGCGTQVAAPVIEATNTSSVSGHVAMEAMAVNAAVGAPPAGLPNSFSITVSNFAVPTLNGTKNLPFLTASSAGYLYYHQESLPGGGMATYNVVVSYPTNFYGTVPTANIVSAPGLNEFGFHIWLPGAAGGSAAAGAATISASPGP